MVIVKDIIRTYYSCDENVKFDIDSTIEQLTKDGALTNKELVVIAVIKEQYSLTEASDVLNISKSTVGRLLDSACEKIADSLGAEYQDSKIIRAVEKKLGRKLTVREEKFCWRKIKDFGRNKYSTISIFNFRMTRDGKIVESGKNKAEG